MGGFLADLLGGPVESKSVGLSDQLIEYFRGSSGSKAGVSVTVDKALQCSTVLACTLAIASGCAMLPFKLYRPKSNGGRSEARDLPLFQVVNLKPNRWQTAVEFKETLITHAVLTGNGYALINRLKGEVRELVPILPDRVIVTQEADHSLTYSVVTTDGTPTVVPPRDMLHLRAPSWNAYGGMDGVRLAREAIGLALATEETHSRLHSNGIRTSGVLQSDQNIGPEQVELLRKQYAEQNSGLENTAKPVLLGGGLKFQQTALTGVDAQHIETRKHQIEEICRSMGVFPALIGHSDKTATFASAEAFFLAHVVHTLSRWTKRIEERFEVDLLTPLQLSQGLHLKHSFQALLRGDNKTRAEFYKSLVMLGIMTRNEARLLEELDPLEGLDEPLTPTNLGGDNVNDIAKAVASMIGHNGGPPLDLDESVERIVKAKLAGGQI